MSLILTLEVVASSHLLLFGLYTAFNRKSRNLGIRLIGVFLSLLGVHFLLLFFFTDHIEIQLAGTWSILDYRPYILNALLLSYGPILWIANKLYLNDSKFLKKSHLWHFILIPIYTILSISIGDSLTSWPNQKLSIDRVIIFAHILVYIIKAIQNSIQEKNGSDVKIKLNILLFVDGMFGFLVITWIAFIFLTNVPDSNSLLFLYIFISLVIAMVDGLLIYFFKYPDLFIQSKYLRSRSSEWSSEKYEYSELSDGYAQAILSQVDDLIVQKLMYKKSSLTLSIVSDKTGFPSRDISQVINSKLNQSFREYLNEIRIRKAAEIFGSKKNLRVNEVMYEVGFSSKSNFHKYFKETYGKTPKQYLKHITLST